MTDMPPRSAAPESAPRRAAPEPAPRRGATQVLELPAHGPRRRFLLAVPADHVLAMRDGRLAELRLNAEGTASADPGLTALRARITASALADACRLAGEEALGALVRHMHLQPVGAPRLETLATPPGGELILRVEVAALPEVTPPDPAALRLERLVAPPDPEEVDRALAALAEARSTWAEMPPDTQAEAGDAVVCAVAARLVSPPDALPPTELDAAEAGTPGCLPPTWRAGDNGSGLAMDIVAVAADADPPHLRLRVHGTAAADGQTYVMFHPPGAIAAAGGSTWSGSVALRSPGTPIGLRGGKLRLDSQPATGRVTLRRRDAAITAAPAFTRCYVSDTLAEPETAFARLVLLLDHAAGPVDITLDIAAPRLVPGLDLGESGALDLPEFAGEARRFELGGEPDPAGLTPHLLGIPAGDTREIVLTLPRDLPDRALAGREAAFELRGVAVFRRTAPVLDDALARTLGLEDLAALRAFAEERVAAHRAALAERQQRAALLDALLAAGGDIPLPEEAVRAEFTAVWPRVAAESPSRDEVMALAARRLRIGLLLAAVARRHGITPDESDLAAAAAAAPGASAEAVRIRALQDRTIAFLLARAQATERAATAAELAAAADGHDDPSR